MAILYNRETALAWDFTEIRKVKPEVSLPVQIRTVDHKAWHCAGFPIPKALNQTVIEMLNNRVDKGMLEPCHGPYRNLWFLIKKKDGKYRLVNHAVEFNKMTIRDANLPPAVNSFSEKFTNYAVTSLIDFFSDYDQIKLDIKFRNITAFITPIGLFRQTIFPQRITNSITQFVRIVIKILQKYIPRVYLLFINNIGVKGPRTTYNNEKATPDIRRYMLEHIMWLDSVLADLE